MKEIYSKPIAEIEKFSTVDVISTSTDETMGGDGGWL